MIRHVSFFLAAAIGLTSLAALWFWMFCLAPKAIGWHIDLGEAPAFPPFIAAMLSASQAGIVIYWPFTFLLGLLIFGGCLPSQFGPVRSWSRFACVAASLFAFLFMAVLGVSVGIANLDLYFAQLNKTRAYVLTLEEFALRETAEGRFEKAQARLNALGKLQAQSIQSANDISLADQHMRVAQLQRLLEEPAETEMRKRLLATSLMFRKVIASNSTKEAAFLKAANNGGFGAFATIDEFYNWLEPRLQTDGWVPLPLYRFSEVQNPGR